METKESIVSSLKLQFQSRSEALEKDRVSNPIYQEIPHHITEQLDRSIKIIQDRVTSRFSHLDKDLLSHQRLLEMISEASFKPGKVNEKGLLMSEYEEALNFFQKRLEDTARLISILENPFFGYIEIEREGKRSSHYIGKYSLVDENSAQVISDWRSQVGEYFYNEAKDTLVKLRFTFRGGVLSSVVDLNQDKYSIMDVFSKDLENRRAGTFKDIISTIQQDQDKVIRDEPEVIYVVQGCAGSGKTSIAVHKLSHHIFNEQIDPTKTLYVTPNRMFSDYLSDVQTSLGLEQVQFKTFLEWGSDILFNKTEQLSDNLSISYKLQDGADGDQQVELVDIDEASEFVNDHTQEALLSYLKDMRNELEQYYRKEIPETVREIIDVDQLIKITQKGGEVIDLLPEIKEVIKRFPFEDGEHFDKFRELTFSFEIFSLYQRYLNSKNIKSKLTISEPEKNDEDKHYSSEVRYDRNDLMNLLMFRKITHGMRDVGHQTLYIDEVQNYSDNEIHTLLEFSEKRQIMVLGDVHQRTATNGQKDLRSLTQLFSQKYPDQQIKFELIDKCYRTTREIMEYSYKPFGEDMVEKYKAQVYFRDGVKPDVYDGEISLPDLLEKSARIANKENYSTIAVIGNDTEVEKFKSQVESKVMSGFQLRQRGDTDYQKGIYFLTNAEIKGLEFDLVIYLRDLGEMLQKGEWTKAADDHIALSRALHRLVVVGV